MGPTTKEIVQNRIQKAKARFTDDKRLSADNQWATYEEMPDPADCQVALSTIII